MPRDSSPMHHRRPNPHASNASSLYSDLSTSLGSARGIGGKGGVHPSADTALANRNMMQEMQARLMGTQTEGMAIAALGFIHGKAAAKESRIAVAQMFSDPSIPDLVFGICRRFPACTSFVSNILVLCGEVPEFGRRSLRNRTVVAFLRFLTSNESLANAFDQLTGGSPHALKSFAVSEGERVLTDVMVQLRNGVSGVRTRPTTLASVLKIVARLLTEPPNSTQERTAMLSAFLYLLADGDVLSVLAEGCKGSATTTATTSAASPSGHSGSGDSSSTPATSSGPFLDGLVAILKAAGQVDSLVVPVEVACRLTEHLICDGSRGLAEGEDARIADWDAVAARLVATMAAFPSTDPRRQCPAVAHLWSSAAANAAVLSGALASQLLQCAMLWMQKGWMLPEVVSVADATIAAHEATHMQQQQQHQQPSVSSVGGGRSDSVSGGEGATAASAPPKAPLTAVEQRHAVIVLLHACAFKNTHGALAALSVPAIRSVFRRYVTDVPTGAGLQQSSTSVLPPEALHLSGGNNNNPSTPTAATASGNNIGISISSIAPAATAEEKVVGELWIAFVHMATYLRLAPLNDLFRPLAEHIAAGRIRERTFQELTRWPRNDANDARRLAQCEFELGALTSLEAEEAAHRGGYDTVFSDIASFYVSFRATLDVLEKDPRFVQKQHEWRVAVCDDERLFHGKYAAIEDTKRDLLGFFQTKMTDIEQTFRDSTAAERAAHASEVDGIVWDADEMATKVLTHTNRLAQLETAFEKEVQHVSAMSQWRLGLCDSILGSLRQMEAQRPRRLLNLEKEEERLRGTAVVSSAQWATLRHGHDAERENISQSEATERAALFASPIALSLSQLAINAQKLIDFSALHAEYTIDMEEECGRDFIQLTRDFYMTRPDLPSLAARFVVNYSRSGSKSPTSRSPANRALSPRTGGSSPTAQTPLTLGGAGGGGTQLFKAGAGGGGGSSGSSNAASPQPQGAGAVGRVGSEGSGRGQNNSSPSGSHSNMLLGIDRGGGSRGSSLGASGHQQQQRGGASTHQQQQQQLTPRGSERINTAEAHARAQYLAREADWRRYYIESADVGLRKAVYAERYAALMCYSILMAEDAGRIAIAAQWAQLFGAPSLALGGGGGGGVLPPTISTAVAASLGIHMGGAGGAGSPTVASNLLAFSASMIMNANSGGATGNNNFAASASNSNHFSSTAIGAVGVSVGGPAQPLVTVKGGLAGSFSPIALNSNTTNTANFLSGAGIAGTTVATTVNANQMVNTNNNINGGGPLASSSQHSPIVAGAPQARTPAAGPASAVAAVVGSPPPASGNASGNPPANPMAAAGSSLHFASMYSQQGALPAVLHTSNIHATNSGVFGPGGGTAGGSGGAAGGSGGGNNNNNVTTGNNSSSPAATLAIAHDIAAVRDIKAVHGYVTKAVTRFRSADLQTMEQHRRARIIALYRIFANEIYSQMSLFLFRTRIQWACMDEETYARYREACEEQAAFGRLLAFKALEERYTAPTRHIHEIERQVRSQIIIDERIALQQMQLHRPRGRRFRPLREVESEPPRQSSEPGVASRIKVWLREGKHLSAQNPPPCFTEVLPPIVHVLSTELRLPPLPPANKTLAAYRDRQQQTTASAASLTGGGSSAGGGLTSQNNNNTHASFASAAGGAAHRTSVSHIAVADTFIDASDANVSACSPLAAQQQQQQQLRDRERWPQPAAGFDQQQQGANANTPEYGAPTPSSAGKGLHAGLGIGMSPAGGVSPSDSLRPNVTHQNSLANLSGAGGFVGGGDGGTASTPVSSQPISAIAGNSHAHSFGPPPSPSAVEGVGGGAAAVAAAMGAPVPSNPSSPTQAALHAAVTPPPEKSAGGAGTAEGHGPAGPLSPPPASIVAPPPSSSSGTTAAPVAAAAMSPSSAFASRLRGEVTHSLAAERIAAALLRALGKLETARRSELGRIEATARDAFVYHNARGVAHRHARATMEERDAMLGGAKVRLKEGRRGIGK